MGRGSLNIPLIATRKIFFPGFILYPITHIGMFLEVVFHAESFATTFEVIDSSWNKIFDENDEKKGKNEIFGE